MAKGKVAWTKLKLFFTHLGKDVWEFLKPFIRIFLSEAGSALATAAMSAVATVAETLPDADGDAKRKAAFDLILNDLKAKGIEMTASMIYSAIEAAVQKRKEDV